MNREQMITHLTLYGFTARGKYRNLGIQRIDGSRVIRLGCDGEIQEIALSPKPENDWRHIPDEELVRFIAYLSAP